MAPLYVPLPLAASHIGTDADVQHLVLPYSITAYLTVAAIHAFLFAVWKIVAFIRTGEFYASPVEHWVKVAKSAAIFGCVLVIAVCLHLTLIENAGGPLILPFTLGMMALAFAGAKLLDLLVGLYREANANIAVFKNGRAKAIRFTTLEAICTALNCQPGDISQWVSEDIADQDLRSLDH